jgi:hypothetical protein
MNRESNFLWVSEVEQDGFSNCRQKYREVSNRELCPFDARSSCGHSELPPFFAHL